MALFAGQDLGIVLTCITSDNPRDTQINAFPGLNGVEALDGGSRGRVTMINGVIGGAGLSGLATIREAIRALRDGNAYALLDTLGVTWLQVQLVRFSPSSRVNQRGDGYCTQEYTAEFRHLIG